LFPGDGCPEVGAAQGGELGGLLKTFAPWTGGSYRVVPARGKVTDAASVRAFRNETHFGSIPGLKDGILLEVGFDQTASNRAVTISSWVVQFVDAKKRQYAETRALDIPCYTAEYTFVEKVQAVVRK
jgi:hypothetical protein